MRNSRALSLLLSLCIIFSIICGATSANATLVDDLDIDPWGDLEAVQGTEDDPVVDVLEPDEYWGVDWSQGYQPGILDLDENSKVRYLTLNNAITYGAGNRTSINSNYKYTWGPVSDYYYSITDGQYNTLATQTDIPETSLYSYSYLTVPAGTYLDVQAVVSYPADTTAKLSANGTLRCYISWRRADSGLSAFPEQVQLLVNGTPIGIKYNMDESGAVAIEAWEIEPEVDITKLGYRFYWNDEQELSQAKESSWFTIPYLSLNYLDSVDFVVTEQLPDPEYNGLLNTIIGWLRSLWDAITELPSNIANLVVNGIKGLFVPSEQDFASMKSDFETLLSEKLGFVYQIFDITIELFNTILDKLETAGEYTFEFPGISFPGAEGEVHTILPEQTISLDNAVMDVLRPILGTAVCFICVTAWATTVFDMVVALISGISYFEWLNRRKEKDE